MVLKDFILARRDVVYNTSDACYSTLYCVISSQSPKSPHHSLYPCDTEAVTV